MRVLWVFLLLAGPLAAQDAFDIGATKACMENAISHEERQYCVGASSRGCMEHLEDMAGMARCAVQETAWWEARMDENIRLISEGTEADTAQVKALLRMQAAWGAYRESHCAFEQAFAFEPEAVQAECMLWLTGDQAVYLEDYVPGY